MPSLKQRIRCLHPHRADGSSLHKSQIMEDMVDVNVGASIIEGRSGGKRTAGSHVRARIVSLTTRRSKIGLTCKQRVLAAKLGRRRTEGEIASTTLCLRRMPHDSGRQSRPVLLWYPRVRDCGLIMQPERSELRSDSRSTNPGNMPTEVNVY